MDSARGAAPVAPATRRTETRRPEIIREVRAAAPAPRDEIGEFTAPLVWNTVRLKIYEQLPSGGADLGFQYTVIPMAITGASETTAPGLGFSGSF